ncbi:conjugative transposon protein TraN [Pedobacter aquatilis]|uniref:conjugative transposon protein TraN n=1 Tax=Pedobacter aquatilis TaxID=351343 RepID=UPI0029316A2B|nr:conjugative transposon protein TraN [Pedobacter aquatilis]
MKNYLFIILLIAFFSAKAQSFGATQLIDLPVIGISKSVSLHFISPEPIQYVDLSSPAIKGDLPVDNILRLQVLKDSVGKLLDSKDGGTVTIVGEKYIAQYRLCYLPTDKIEFISSQIDILPEYMKPLDISAVELSRNELRRNALSILKNRSKKPLIEEKRNGIGLALNQIYTVGDYVFLDLGFSNSTNLSYSVDELRLKIEDRKINNATNVQSIEVKPVFQLYPLKEFRKAYRNIYAIKKASFPESKVLNVYLNERQISGRSVVLPIKYKDVMQAETF